MPTLSRIRSRRQRGRHACTALLAALLTSSHLLAQQPRPSAAPSPAPTSADASAKQEAARRFEHAIKLYEDADYVLALAEFERVYELVPDYRVLFNIGQVSIQLGRYARALRTLNEYLKRAAGELPSEREQAVRGDLESLAGRTARIALQVQEAGAEISIDGSVVGTSPLSEPLIVDVGERTVQVKLTGYRTHTQSFSLAGGDKRDARIALEAEQIALAPAATPLPASKSEPWLRPTPPAKRPSSWVWVGYASAGTLATGALVTGILGASAATELEDLRGTAGTSREALNQAQTRLRTRLLLADVLGGAALVTGAVTFYVHLSGSRSRDHAASSTALKLQLEPTRIALALEH